MHLIIENLKRAPWAYLELKGVRAYMYCTKVYLVNFTKYVEAVGNTVCITRRYLR